MVWPSLLKILLLLGVWHWNTPTPSVLPILATTTCSPNQPMCEITWNHYWSLCKIASSRPQGRYDWGWNKVAFLDLPPQVTSHKPLRKQINEQDVWDDNASPAQCLLHPPLPLTSITVTSQGEESHITAHRHCLRIAVCIILIVLCDNNCNRSIGVGHSIGATYSVVDEHAGNCDCWGLYAGHDC